MIAAHEDAEVAALHPELETGDVGGLQRGRERDIGAGALEGGTYLAVALFVTRLA